MARFWWAIATGAAVVGVLTLVVVYELLVVGPPGASAGEAVRLHLFVAAVAATAGAAATIVLRLEPGAGTSFTALVLGTAVGGGTGVLLAFATGNGPDEGDGFFWLTVASLIVGLVAAAIAALTAKRVGRA